MPASSSYPQGFKNGLILRNMPLLQTQPGQVFWVNNGTVLGPGEVGGSNGNDGTFYKPFATLAYAMTRCTANHSDIIMVKAGHAETISSAAILTLTVAGVAIIGLGSGSLRPTLTFSSVATANIPVTASNISIQNVLFVANFLDITSVFTVTGTAAAKEFNVEGCEFRDGTSVNFISIITGNATANTSDGLRFCGNRISSLGTTAATTAIKLNSATDRVTILDNYGNWAVLNDTAAMLAGGANAITNLDFGRNVLNRPNTSSTGGSFISSSSTACTGHCYDNYMFQLDASSGIWIATGTKLAFTNNRSAIAGAADKSGAVNPVEV